MLTNRIRKIAGGGTMVLLSVGMLSSRALALNPPLQCNQNLTYGGYFYHPHGTPPHSCVSTTCYQEYERWYEGGYYYVDTKDYQCTMGK